MILIPVVFFAPVFIRRKDQLAPDLKLWHRMLCVLLSYIFLVGPECFHMLAQADTQYSDLVTASWGSGNRTIEYEYDANGSQTKKTTKQTLPLETLEVVDYVYSLQNRLAQVTTTPYTGGSPGTPEVVDYTYNPSGIRVQKVIDDTYRTNYLVDPSNHTGYAQVLEEWTYDVTIPSNPSLLSAVYYTIGDDVIAQTRAEDVSNTWTVYDTECLLYDGHGSTRQLIKPNLTVTENYSYDAYGIMLGDNTDPKPAQTAMTNLLYTGEQHDSTIDQYYLRARYYNQSSGVFNRMDDFPGNLHDPQSLHKYLYAHNNPTNAIDPTGMMTYVEVLSVTAIIGKIIVASYPYVMAGLLTLTTAAIVGLLYELTHEYIAAGMSATAEAIRSHTQQIKQALRNAARKLKEKVKDLLKQKPYFVFEKFTPNIYKFTVSCLATNPMWYRLTWHGRPDLTARNRAWVLSRYGYLRKPGHQIDEFPYASTYEGGRGARGWPVPAFENRAQGAYLKAHYYGILRKPRRKFLVIPVPKF